MSKEPNRNVYVGHRYVPLILEEWDNKISYEGLSVVTHKGASYTSKKRVPVGIDILNKEYWSLTGNYNAQIEYYREETERVSEQLDTKTDQSYTDTELGKKADKSYTDTELGKKADTSFVNTELGKKADQSYTDTELGKKADKSYTDTELDKKADTSFVNTELDKKESQIGFKPVSLNGQSIQTALNNNKIVTLEYGKEYITDTTITVPEDTEIHLNGAIIKPSKSHDIFNIKNGACIYGGKIDVRGVENYSGSVILIDGVERSNFHQKSRFRDIEIVGDINSNKGNAIMLKAENPGDFVLWTIFNSITINGFDKGIYLKATKQTTGVNFVNGNTFSDIFISYCVYNIYIEANNVDRHPVEGNLFSNIIHQTGAKTKRILYCEGATNRFDMYLFDFYASSSNTAIELTETSEENFVNINGSTVSLIEDRGRRNEVKNPRSLSDNIIQPPNVDGNVFLGNQDDFLANSGMRYDVTVPSGHEVTSGVLSSMFNLYPGASAVFPNASKSNPLMIEIDMSNEPLSLLEVFGINFLYGDTAKNIKVETYNGTEWKTKINIENNYKQNFLMREKEVRVEKLKITLSESLSDVIRISRIFASSNQDHGRSFLSTGGGDMYGEIEFTRPSRGIILTNGNGDRYRLRVSNDGTLATDLL